jgi:hypothetical protein
MLKDNNSENENETEVNLDPPTKTEIWLALTQLKNGKAAGLDNINPEILKVDPEITVEMLYPLLKKIWKEKIPLYAFETWKTTNQITRRLQTFINKCLRQIMSIK